MNSYYPGELVTVTVNILSEPGGTLIDPTTLTLSIGTGAQGMTTIYTWGVGSEIVHVSTGVFDAEIDTTGFAPGIWYQKWVSPNGSTAQVVGVSYFKILQSPI